MKRSFVIALCCAFAHFCFAQNFGINEPNPTQKLDVNGWIEVGNESAGSAGTPGAIRYHSSGKLQVYNGSQWLDLLTTGVPVASVHYFATSTAPAGYLECNGQAVSRTTYADLFAAIGTLYGAGNGSSTFNLPDLRGTFIRGIDNGRGLDPGRGFGSFQDMDWKGFTMSNTRHNTFDYSHGPQYFGKSTSSFVGNMFTGYWSAPAAAIGMQWDGSEIRPRNVALLPCIKH